MLRWQIMVVALGLLAGGCGDDGSSDDDDDGGGGGTMDSDGQTVSETQVDGGSGGDSGGASGCASLTDVLIVESPMVGDPSAICGDDNDPESLAPIGTLIDTDDGDLAVCVGAMGRFSTDVEPSSQAEGLPRPMIRYFGLYTYVDEDNPQSDPELPHFVAMEVALHAGGDVATGCQSSHGFGTHSGSSFDMAGVQVDEFICPTDDAWWRTGAPAEITVRLSTGEECDVTLHEIPE